jgi:hypothetical protein
MKVKIQIDNVPVHGNGQISLIVRDSTEEVKDYHCDDTDIKSINEDKCERFSITGLNRIYANKSKCKEKEFYRFADVEAFEVEIAPDAEIIFGLTKWFKKQLSESGEIKVDFKDKMVIDDADRDCNLKMQWQPIERAPRDGTPILLYSTVFREPAVAVGSWNSDLIDFVMMNSSLFTPGMKPSHWMPLPESPKE